MSESLMVNPMTNEQIEEVVGKLRDEMYKHRDKITSDAAEQVLEVENLGMMMFAPFRKHAEAVSNLIVRKVPVNRNRNRQEALDATNRTQYTNRKVVDAMPTGDSPAGEDEVEIVFFKPDLSQRNGIIYDDDLENEFELRGLKPADPISVAAVNEADPAFADEKPHGTHWKDAKGNWCCATFDRWRDQRGVHVDRFERGWRDYWWFAGVRK